MVGSYIDYRAAQAFVSLTWGLAGFLSLIIVLEALIVVYARSKIDVFAEETLNENFTRLLSYLFAAFLTIRGVRFVV